MRENAEASFALFIRRQQRRSFRNEAHATFHPGWEGYCRVRYHWPILFLGAGGAGMCTEFRMLCILAIGRPCSPCDHADARQYVYRLFSCQRATVEKHVIPSYAILYMTS